MDIDLDVCLKKFKIVVFANIVLMKETEKEVLW